MAENSAPGCKRTLVRWRGRELMLSTAPFVLQSLGIGRHRHRTWSAEAAFTHSLFAKGIFCKEWSYPSTQTPTRHLQVVFRPQQVSRRRVPTWPDIIYKFRCRLLQVIIDRPALCSSPGGRASMKILSRSPLIYHFLILERLFPLKLHCRYN